MEEIKEWPPEKLEELKKENEKLKKTMEFLKQAAMVEYMDYFTLEDNNVSGNVFTMNNFASGSTDIIIKLKINGKTFDYIYEISMKQIRSSNRLSEIMGLFHESLGRAVADWSIKHIHLGDI